MEKVIAKLYLIVLGTFALALAGCAEKSESSAKDDKPVYSVPVPLA